MRRLGGIAAVLVAAGLAGGVACGSDSGGSSPCVEGTVVDCMTVEGCSGTRTCTATGVYGTCECGGGGAAGSTGTGGSVACPAGSELCPCYGNNSCDGSLTCASGLCVMLGGGGEGGSGGAVTGGSGGAVTGGSGGTGGGTGGSVTGGSGGTCALSTVQAHLSTVNFIFTIDRSQSMGDTSPFQNLASRWNPVVQGILAFMNEPASSRAYAAMDFFPADGFESTACDLNQYRPPNFTVPLTSLDTSGAFATALAAIAQQGGTPTWPAMRGALDYAAEVAMADPTAKTIVVLISDGIPGLNMVQADGGPPTMREVCQEIGATTVPNTVPEIVNIVRAAYQATPQILTYVFGITDAASTLASFNLIALAGSGDQENATLIETTDPAQTAQIVQNKLSEIRTNSVTCDVPIPDPTTGDPMDPGMVNVNVTIGGQLTLIRRSDGCVGTAPGLGWYYDDPVTPTKITLCPVTCSSVQGNATAQITVEFGCPTAVQ